MPCDCTLLFVDGQIIVQLYRGAKSAFKILGMNVAIVKLTVSARNKRMQSIHCLLKLCFEANVRLRQILTKRKIPFSSPFAYNFSKSYPGKSFYSFFSLTLSFSLLEDSLPFFFLSLFLHSLFAALFSSDCLSAVEDEGTESEFPLPPFWLLSSFTLNLTRGCE